MDKVLHLLVGAVIAISVGKATEPKYGIYTAIALGIGKEIYDQLDKSNTSHADFLDAMATAGGGFMGKIVIEF